MSSIDWNCVVALFSLGKKIKQKFWMQSNKDRQVILLEKMAHACLVSEWIPAPCGAALAKHRSEIAWVVQSCLSSLALGSMETTSAMELCAKSLTCSDNVGRKDAKVGWVNGSNGSTGLGNTFLLHVCLSFGEASVFIWCVHIKAKCWVTWTLQKTFKSFHWRNVAVNVKDKRVWHASIFKTCTYK